MTSIATLSDQLQAFVIQKFPLARNRRIGIDDALVESGIIDSLGVLALIGFIEAEFQVQIDDDDLLPDNFRTIRRLSELILIKLGALGPTTHDNGTRFRQAKADSQGRT
jgi:acyl carrier protein